MNALETTSIPYLRSYCFTVTLNTTVMLACMKVCVSVCTCCMPCAVFSMCVLRQFIYYCTAVQSLLHVQYEYEYLIFDF